MSCSSDDELYNVDNPFSETDNEQLPEHVVITNKSTKQAEQQQIDKKTVNTYKRRPFNETPCIFYSKGYCKHGNNCRFLHLQGMEKNKREMTEDVKQHMYACWDAAVYKQELLKWSKEEIMFRTNQIEDEVKRCVCQRFENACSKLGI